MARHTDPRSATVPGRGKGRITREQRRDSLLDVAAALVVSDSPEALTMELVAERSGVSRPLVYKHFANREELLGALYRREARRLDAELADEVGAATTVVDMYRALVRGALRATAERGHLFSVLRQTSGSGGEVRREQRFRDDRTFRAFARRTVEELGTDPRLTPPTTSLLLSLIDPVLAQWRLDPTPEHAALLEESYLLVVTAALRDLEGERSPEEPPS